MTSLVLGYTWVDGGVVLRIRRSGEQRRTEVRLSGSIRLGVSDQTQCTGYQRDGERLPCPQRSSPRGKICATCASQDEFRPCMICDGSRCPRLSRWMERACRQTHHLYIASFGGDFLKVGTASDRRRDQRLVEQGPLAAARVAAAEGPVIKRMEAALVRAGFTEAVSRQRKMSLLRSGMTVDAARDRVRDAVRHLGDQLPSDLRWPLHPPHWVEAPALALRSRGFPVNALPVLPDTVIEGQVAGAIGHVLFLDDGDGRFALDLGALVGRFVDFDPSGPRQKKPQVQMGLF